MDQTDSRAGLEEVAELKSLDELKELMRCCGRCGGGGEDPDIPGQQCPDCGGTGAID